MKPSFRGEKLQIVEQQFVNIETPLKRDEN